jgi:hypothetical protein
MPSRHHFTYVRLVAVCQFYSCRQNPEDELRREAPQLVFWACILTRLATAMKALLSKAFKKYQLLFTK